MEKSTMEHLGEKLEELREFRQRCEVWTRVMGYHRPVSEFNPGKLSEHRERFFFQWKWAKIALEAQRERADV